MLWYYSVIKTKHDSKMMASLFSYRNIIYLLILLSKNTLYIRSIVQDTGKHIQNK